MHSQISSYLVSSLTELWWNNYKDIPHHVSYIYSYNLWGGLVWTSTGFRSSGLCEKGVLGLDSLEMGVGICCDSSRRFGATGATGSIVIEEGGYCCGEDERECCCDNPNAGIMSSLTGSSKWVGEISTLEASILGVGAERPDPRARVVADRLRPARAVGPAGVPNWGVSRSLQPLAFSVGSPVWRSCLDSSLTVWRTWYAYLTLRLPPGGASTKLWRVDVDALVCTDLDLEAATGADLHTSSWEEPSAASTHRCDPSPYPAFMWSLLQIPPKELLRQNLSSDYCQYYTSSSNRIISQYWNYRVMIYMKRAVWKERIKIKSKKSCAEL